MAHLLAQASGSRGMAGGQAIDLESVGLALTQEQLEFMHLRKTGALIRAAVLLGAWCSDKHTPCRCRQLRFVRNAGVYGAGSLCQAYRPGVSGDRRYPGQRSRHRHAGQDLRQG